MKRPGSAVPILVMLLVLLVLWYLGSVLLNWRGVADAFKLTGHFLDLHVWGPRGIASPSMREALIASLTKHAE